jgi:hypothetical protein
LGNVGQPKKFRPAAGSRTASGGVADDVERFFGEVVLEHRSIGGPAQWPRPAERKAWLAGSERNESPLSSDVIDLPWVTACPPISDPRRRNEIGRLSRAATIGRPRPIVSTVEE